MIKFRPAYIHNALKFFYVCVCAGIAKLSSFVPSNYFAQLVKDKARVVFTGKSCSY